MPSRFRRGITKKKKETPEIIDAHTTTRKVYVQFTEHIPDQNPEKKRKCDYINGWICTCKNGRRLAGCCSHVACVIYYLSCAYYKREIKYPAKYLKYSKIETSKKRSKKTTKKRIRPLNN